MDATTYHIGAVAGRTGLSLRTVRYYEEVGLVRPSGRSEGGFRLYTESDVQRLLLIRSLRPVELSTEELTELLELHQRITGAAPESAELALEPAALAGARERLASLLERATERLRLKRERLLAAEVAVELLRATCAHVTEPEA